MRNLIFREFNPLAQSCMVTGLVLNPALSDSIGPVSSLRTSCWLPRLTIQEHWILEQKGKPEIMCKENYFMWEIGAQRHEIDLFKSSIFIQIYSNLYHYLGNKSYHFSATCDFSVRTFLAQQACSASFCWDFPSQMKLALSYYVIYMYNTHMYICTHIIIYE